MVRISSARMDMEDARIDKAVFKDHAEKVVTVASSSTAYTVDLTTGNFFDVTLTGNCTFTFINPSASGTVCSFTLLLRQDATGSRTAVWPTSVVWPSSTAPTLTTTAGRVDIITFFTLNAGTRWVGSVGGQNFVP